MPSSAYWKKRFEQIEQSQNQLGKECYADIEKQFRTAQKELEKQIAVWYQRFAKNNGVGMLEARRMLDKRELEELKWDVDEYIRKGKENAINGQWIKELENASARYHISRLEALRLHTQQCVEMFYGNQLDSVDKTMRNVYRSGYYRTAYEVQKGFGIGWDFVSLDEKTIAKVINKPWAADGENFSSRIWKHKSKLVNELNTTLTQNIILGQDPQKAIDIIAKRLDVQKNVAGRLVMTEEAFFSSAAQRDCFGELDVEKYEIVATLDSHTSEICRNMDGEHFPISQWEVGVTAPPFHVWCRSTTVPYFEDDFGEIGKRAARGEDGKAYYIPANMTYKQWKQSFIGGGDKSELKEIKPSASAKRGKASTYPADITEEWVVTKGASGNIIEKKEYTANGTKYIVDGKHVVLKPTKQERLVAETLCNKYGKIVEFVPQVLHPQGIQTPDYLINGERYDLKSPTGVGKNLLYGLIAKKRKQSHNFVIDITNCPLSMEDLIKQVDELYRSPRVGFLEKLVLIKNGEVVKVLSR